MARLILPSWVEPPPPAVPDDADVERYRRLRAAERKLNDRLTATVPRRAMDETAEALGILRDGVLVFESDTAMNVLMDCCLYEWVEDGRDLVRKFADGDPTLRDALEREVLEARLRSRYAVIYIEECVPGRGARAVDFFSDEDIFVIDTGLSRSVDIEEAALATRIMPIGEFWMTGGAALPLVPEAAETLDRMLRRRVVPAGGADGAWVFEDPETVLAVVRGCIEGGALELVSTRSAATFERVTRRPSRNAPCSCGSGRKYKRCCGSERRRSA
ncbi:MAG: YecA family protein [Planctomycetota bacterium]|jgi:hypothetical protein